MKYRTLVADPPWRYPAATHWANNVGGRTARYYDMEEHYPSMSIEEIAALPISDLAEKEAHLYLWTTNRHLPFAFGVMEAWGFGYRQTLVWDKPRHIPLGSVAPQGTEYLLFGVRGNLGVTKAFPSTIIRASGRKPHSRKPEAFLDYIEQASPGPYLELFARRNRFGWHTWGNQSFEHVDLEVAT